MGDINQPLNKKRNGRQANPQNGGMDLSINGNRMKKDDSVQ